MGAKINIEGKTAIIKGVRKLYGTNVKATDLRGGAALVLAGIMAKGTTTEYGLVGSYFANPFGPVQRREQTEPILQDYFCNLGTSQCIDQGVMVILQIEPDVSGYRIQSVIG